MKTHKPTIFSVLGSLFNPLWHIDSIKLPFKKVLTLSMKNLEAELEILTKLDIQIINQVCVKNYSLYF